MCLHEITHPIFNLLFLSALVAIGGLYISNVSPRAYYLQVQDTTVVLDGWKTIVIDVLFHIAPFIFVWFAYSHYYFASCRNTIVPLLNSLILVIVYAATARRAELYHVEQGDVRVIAGAAALLMAAWIYAACS